ncbi:MAG: 2-oxoglutarate dehydrogenase E2 component (dihydrolipoamide succinyltransferase) [Fusobacteria bacterium]|nr:MAG: 2-oxoglutarate dehydrogenase E2 component (dihydrolipoamide succinyltransferase) [Fusobacteriota bacterium]KAF0227892.1 MAG: 2-oxoglutarate dehydrogenase E2 component [Fusobacteriota bacterium]
MSTVIEMPRYGANMDEGTIATWFVEEGESVTKGQAIAEIAIEKLSNELLAPEDGIILKLVGAEGETYDCGTPIAYIGQQGEDIEESTPTVQEKSPEIVQDQKQVADVVSSSDATIVVMPRYGANMEEGTVSTWFFSAGDMVEEGDVIAEIAIEKLTNELMAPVAGPFYPLVEEGATVNCGKTIAKIGEGEVAAEGEVFSQCSPSEMEVVENNKPVVEVVEVNEEVAADSNSYGSSVLTTKAQKLADELGVNATRIKGTGYYNMVTREDIKKAYDLGLLKNVALAPTPINRKMTAMEKAIASGMYKSLQETAQTTITMDMDVDNLVEFYQANKTDYAAMGVKLSYTSVLVNLIAKALKEYPIMRTVIEDNMFKELVDVNIGIAIDVEGGLFVPNIKNADKKFYSAVATELAQLAEKAKAGKLTENDLSYGSFTMTNLGMFGIKYFTPVLNIGESAILGLGAIRRELAVRDGGFYKKNLMSFSLTHDHRVINGAPAARFLNRIQELINEI